MTIAGDRILSALRDIQERRYRSITFTQDGTCIIVCAETGKTASGRSFKDADANFRRAE